MHPSCRLAGRNEARPDFTGWQAIRLREHVFSYLH